MKEPEITRGYGQWRPSVNITDLQLHVDQEGMEFLGGHVEPTTVSAFAFTDDDEIIDLTDEAVARREAEEFNRRLSEMMVPNSVNVGFGSPLALSENWLDELYALDADHSDTKPAPTDDIEVVYDEDDLDPDGILDNLYIEDDEPALEEPETDGSEVEEEVQTIEIDETKFATQTIVYKRSWGEKAKSWLKRHKVIAGIAAVALAGGIMIVGCNRVTDDGNAQPVVASTTTSTTIETNSLTSPTTVRGYVPGSVSTITIAPNVQLGPATVQTPGMPNAVPREAYGMMQTKAFGDYIQTYNTYPDMSDEEFARAVAFAEQVEQSQKA